MNARIALFSAGICFSLIAFFGLTQPPSTSAKIAAAVTPNLPPTPRPQITPPPPTIIRAPYWDSGWIAIAQSEEKTLTHNRGSNFTLESMIEHIMGYRTMNANNIGGADLNECGEIDVGDVIIYINTQ